MILVDDRKAQRYARCRRWAKAHPEKTRQYWVKWRANNLEKARRVSRENKRRKRAKEKQACIAAYGGKCSCCGEADIRFLTIDHKHGGGSKHRKSGNRHRINFYDWLRLRGYPKEDYQCLCFNCNCGRSVNKGICPHKDIQ